MTLSSLCFCYSCFFRQFQSSVAAVAISRHPLPLTHSHTGSTRTTCTLYQERQRINKAIKTVKRNFQIKTVPRAQIVLFSGVHNSFRSALLAIILISFAKLNSYFAFTAYCALIGFSTNRPLTTAPRHKIFSIYTLTITKFN